MNKIIIFGASGDLAKKKLLPAISKIYTKDMEVIGYSRSDLEGSFSREMRRFFDYKADFPEKVRYIKGQYNDLSPLREVIDPNTILYFSVPPVVYEQILSGLAGFDFGIVGIEKPFGSDLQSFRKSEHFKSGKIRFIDHYLLKPLVLSVTEILHRDKTLLSFFSDVSIRSIDCYFIESILVEGKAYFDSNGTVKDVMQNHLAETLATILCCSLDTKLSRVDFIRSLKIDGQRCIFGQYETYQRDVRAGSQTETFALLKCSSEDRRWKNTPILMMAGKCMDRRAAEIVFNVRNESFGTLLDALQDRISYTINKCTIGAVKLVFNVSPASEIYLEMLVEKTPVRVILYDSTHVERVKASRFGDYQDYEIIFSRLIDGSYFPSASYEEVLELWRIFDTVNTPKKSLVYYKNGSEMPDEARALVNTIKD